MPTPSDVLIDAHHDAQVRNATVTALAVQRLWDRMVRADSLATSAQEWVTVVVLLILRQRRFSAALALQYLNALRRMEIGDTSPFIPTPAPEPDLEVFRTSLWVTGPKAFEDKVDRLKPNTDLDAWPSLERRLLEQSGEQAAGAVSRHVQNGAKDQIKEYVKQDTKALGWLRVTDADPCYFCSMLASRGPVYDKESFDDADSLFSGGGISKTHDNCGCTMVPVYDRSASVLDRSKELESLWAEVTRGESGQDAINAWRRYHRKNAA